MADPGDKHIHKKVIVSTDSHNDNLALPAAISPDTPTGDGKHLAADNPITPIVVDKLVQIAVFLSTCSEVILFTGKNWNSVIIIS
jgi:hypothetical protein